MVDLCFDSYVCNVYTALHDIIMGRSFTRNPAYRFASDNYCESGHKMSDSTARWKGGRQLNDDSD